MTPLILSVAAVLTTPFAFAHHQGPGVIQASASSVEGWRIELRRDPFLDRTTCRLRRGSMTLDRGVMVFRFPSSVETAQAYFKIDAGPAEGVQSVAMEVAGQGVSLIGNDVRHPGEGRVAIPLRLLRTAQVVTIRPNDRLGARSFSLGGLDPALAAAQRQGCASRPDTVPTS